MKKENDMAQMLDLSTHPYGYDPYGAYTQISNLTYGNDPYAAAYGYDPYVAAYGYDPYTAAA
jgi:hypothetical protein